ncbi:Asp-tRNA(Asn)/Glu-tRNA(Gln) amidotransferase subunit GatC [Candidatus Cryosericum terrychapinii]|jgi:aspartyl-tRNA(Asn)/glutamyl-tRNA(Gln) amidotransferase subunit C|uniref:Aspartyl/glutamyl-tRNA(Asn/Gln) amidotransferase subunit C n=1 Tax=Candidatus Cryosericum terrychapinii TaxID=2290919 RepID=A0A398CWP3_9BACT|nr:Asp-tRNA(Asn)/Glu-tRNA(Gln) amidotransferase subunit GatC [Candidatus Cryosericum terrychapinii]RIE06963.1 Asp-tRNA(Asn)/Glu-tRNA(Gln) amidotransferase GatCAB subunit C [Candidatus Cryosericum terrychapinii]
MIIDKETLEHVASLARLEITPDEDGSLLGDLERILGYVAQLGSVDTSAIVSKRPAMTELRPDEPGEGLTREAGLGGAPAMRDGFIVVRNVMGGEDE